MHEQGKVMFVSGKLMFDLPAYVWSGKVYVLERKPHV